MKTNNKTDFLLLLTLSLSILGIGGMENQLEKESEVSVLYGGSKKWTELIEKNW